MLPKTFSTPLSLRGVNYLGTKLFFLGEATALASSHPPCAECRHANHHRFNVA
jgi:hypothetical protein